MDQWSILVLGTLRLSLNADYDRIQELANQHRTLKMMLGHGLFDADKDSGTIYPTLNYSTVSEKTITTLVKTCFPHSIEEKSTPCPCIRQTMSEKR